MSFPNSVLSEGGGEEKLVSGLVRAVRTLERIQDEPKASYPSLIQLEDVGGCWRVFHAPFERRSSNFGDLRRVV